MMRWCVIILIIFSLDCQYANISKMRYKNLISHFEKNGVKLRTHGLVRKASNRENVLRVTGIDSIVTYIKTFAKKVAIPLPGRVSYF